MKINCIVIDDEAPAIEQMVDYIGRVPFLECMATFDNALDAVPYLKMNPVDLIFLDIEMERFTGLQMLKTLRVQTESCAYHCLRCLCPRGFQPRCDRLFT